MIIPARYAIIFLLLASVASGCRVQVDRPDEIAYPADAVGAEIPIRFEGAGDASLVVAVYVDDEGPFDMVVDTGATVTCVDQELVGTLDLDTRPGAALGAGAERTGRMEMVTLRSLRVGEVEAGGLTACVLDLEHIRGMGIAVHGLLGLNFLRAFRVTLDFERGVMRLEQP